MYLTSLITLSNALTDVHKSLTFVHKHVPIQNINGTRVIDNS